VSGRQTPVLVVLVVLLSLVFAALTIADAAAPLASGVELVTP